jgi:hypothetical protein
MKLPFAAAVCLTFSPALFGQPTMPSWLVNYPGATATLKTFPALVEATYTTDAAPDLVTDHYRKLFEAQNLVFQPNSDGIGVAVRAAAECDLLISIRAGPIGHPAGTSVRVSCAAKSQSTDGYRALTPAESAIDRHHQLVAELGIHKQREDADAPPVVWPEWLVHVQSARLSPQAGVDQAGNQFMHSRYVTSVPMTSIFGFYKDLLTAHEYPVHTGKIMSGHTQTGVQQNAYGEVEGINYPNGFPGPWTEIKVRFTRSQLNEPITVNLTLTTYAYKAPKR